MTALVIAEGFALVLLALLVAGLLRSHAEILRRLHELGAGLETDAGSGHIDHTGHTGHTGHTDLGFPVPPGRALPSAAGARPAADVSGQTPSGEFAHVAVTGTDRDTLIAFLSTGCRTCAGFWSSMADGPGSVLPTGTSLLVVTRSADEENLGRIQELAPHGVTVVLSTEAWDAYEVPVAPYFVHVEGSAGRVVGEGAAATWRQVGGLVGDATADRRARRLPGRKTSPVKQHDAADLDASDLTGSARREERIDAELRAAGIEPGDPSLYLDSESLYAPRTPDPRTGR